jgi:hypothetical protein
MPRQKRLSGGWTLRTARMPTTFEDMVTTGIREERRVFGCANCGSTGHYSGSDTCPGSNEQDRLEDPNQQEVAE